MYLDEHDKSDLIEPLHFYKTNYKKAKKDANPSNNE
jgi:hypothetical protein